LLHSFTVFISRIHFLRSFTAFSGFGGPPSSDCLSVDGLNRTGPQRGAIFFSRVKVILSACRPIGTGAVPGAISAAIAATISTAISTIRSAFNAAVSGKWAGNAGAIEQQSGSRQEQDQCDYWILIHH
jgi:Flp pilus assembly pilin Flp